MQRNGLKYAVILGTRPEIIKMSPVIRLLRDQEDNFFLLHTGQHYSYEMDRLFFAELGLPEAKYNLEVGSCTHGQQTGKMLAGIEQILEAEAPHVVLVEGDTNSVLAGALAAAKLHIGVGHVEAGLRSWDRRMPEEINRVVTDHVSDLLFAPTESAAQNLRDEGLPFEKIFVTGNTVVDAVQQHLAVAAESNRIERRLGLQPDGFFLVTAHREENADDLTRLSGILEGLRLVSREFGMPGVFPMHPRTQKRMSEFGLAVPPEVIVVGPVGYLEFLLLISHSRLILTDSGGVQEEACITRVPCVTLRDNTERPETVTAGGNLLAGCDPARILDAAREMMSTTRDWVNPFGDGRAAERIVALSTERLCGESLLVEPAVPSKVR